MIVGDANLCEVATFLKVGTTAIVLAMVEDGFIDKDLSIANPVPSMRTVSHDVSLRATVDVADLGSCTTIELQWEFLRLARKYADESLRCHQSQRGLADGGDAAAGPRWLAIHGHHMDTTPSPMACPGRARAVRHRVQLRRGRCDDYERLRPGYSEDAVAWLLTTATRARDGRVADVAAGTGKLTRMLAGAGVAVTAVEPSAAMRTVLRSVTRVPVIAAVAEALPFADSALACVCVAQAFHHLDYARALPELHRVLAPGSHLALLWNWILPSRGIA